MLEIQRGAFRVLDSVHLALVTEFPKLMYKDHVLSGPPAGR